MSPFSSLLPLSGKMRSKNTSDPESSASLPPAPGMPGHPHKCQKLLLGRGRKQEASPGVTKASRYLPQGKEGRELKQFNSLCCQGQAAECFMWHQFLDLYGTHSEKIC